MSKRNFSMQKYWDDIAAGWEPLLSFRGSTYDQWQEWRKQASAKLTELLGDFPERVELRPEVEYSVRDGDLIRERVIFDVDGFMSVPCILLKPADMKNDGANPAILCSHGHGPYGKDTVAGMCASAGHSANISEMNYDYAVQMAKAGFLTITPDLRAFGERGEGSQDICNINFIKGAVLGIYTLTLNIWDFKCCIDYLETRPEVDHSRIGMMGLSQGGTMTAFTTAVEPRIKAADIIGYVNPFEKFAINRANFCGSQMVPGIYKYFDTHDIAGLIAPRPLLVEMGIYDNCFFIQDLLEGYNGIKRIYTAANAADVLYSDVHSGSHAFAGNKAFEFFKKHL